MSRINETHTSAVASKERDLIASQVELAAANNKLGALKVREMELQDALGRAHEEDHRPCTQEMSELLGRDKDETTAAWARERATLQATAGHHESNAVKARKEAERLRGELAAAKLELEEAKLRLISPNAAGNAPGSGSKR